MRILIIILNLLSFSCNNHLEDTLDLGKPIPQSATQIDTSALSNLVLYKPNQFMPSRLIVYDGIKYNVCLDNANNVIFIFTTDTAFRSPEGYKIGDSFNDIKKSSITKKFYTPGFGVDIFLYSEWRATFLDQEILKNGNLSNISKVKSFYKRLE